MTEDGSPLRLSVSIGIACFPDDAGSAKALLNQADKAMYEAKKAGRNRVRAVAPVTGGSAGSQGPVTTLS